MRAAAMASVDIARVQVLRRTENVFIVRSPSGVTIT
jgi:hypothetical protein